MLRRPRPLAGPLLFPGGKFRQLGLRVQRTEPHADFVLFPVPAINQRDLPLLREDAENIFELVHAVDWPAGERDDLVIDAQPATVRVRLVENLRDDDRPVRITRNRRAQRRVVDNPARAKVTQKIADLIDRDRVAGARVHSAALRNRDAAVNTDQFAGPVEERSAGIPRIDGRVDLQAVGVFQNRISRVLITVDAAHDAVSRRRLKIGGEQKGVSEHIDPVAGADGIAVAPRGSRKIVAAQRA